MTPNSETPHTLISLFDNAAMNARYTQRSYDRMWL